MGISERKQRERAEREKRILKVGLRMLIDRGYHGLTMDRIADKIEYSKGIVYQHFSSKEDLLCAMTIELLEDVVEHLRRGAAFPGRARERLTATAIGTQLLFRRNPDRFQAQQILWVSSIAHRASDKRKAQLDRLHAEAIRLFGRIIDEAIGNGELTIPSGVPPLRVVLGMWSLLVGSEIVRHGHPDDSALEESRFDLAVRWNLQAFLDGLGWRPLSMEWDYEATAQRVLSEVFSDECDKLRRGKTVAIERPNSPGVQ